MRIAHRLRASVAALACVALLSACTPWGQQPGSAAPSATSQANETAIAGSAPELKKFYTQSVAWEPCKEKDEAGMSCAKIMVPLDYAKPDGATIDIQAIKIPATGKKIGSLLTNPGGPGGSGIEFVRDAGMTNFSAKVRASYDIVGFDPRGVRSSAPVTCLTDKERDEYRAIDYKLDTDAGLAKSQADNKKIIAECQKKTGEILGHVDTVSAAKDLDVLRATSNDAKLNYVGYSYGTFLGSTYAQLFPDKVGRVVLDGALDPALSNEELTLGQAKAFEAALKTYVTSCLQGSDCPLSGTPDEGMQQIRDLIASFVASPQKNTDGRVVTASSFVSGLILPLYNDANWPMLTSALSLAISGDPSAMMYLADLGADRSADGSYTSNSTFAFNAINCLDYPMVSDVATMRQDAEVLKQASPTFGEFFAYGGSNCVGWPYKPLRTPAPASYTGENTVVVIGTTGDPATPYAWAGALRKEMGNASLLTWKGEGHTAYGRSNECVRNAVDGYLVDGKTPKDGTTC
ncbi:alpha/beta fold hydrolase [Pseudarthrobacter sp. J1763]|uniref:alpha/beta hydrolase n=1 Tax=Pseudarthrobacter sp. J1763 TaxID=3420445 RepID=UPI003D2DF47A